MHRNNILVYIQQDVTLNSLFYLKPALHVSSGTITHNQERKQLYLQHLVFFTPLLLLAGILEELELVWVCCGWRRPAFSKQGPLHYRGFTIILRHTALGRTPLDEWSARRRDLYLTTHNTHKRQTSMPPAGFEPTIPAGERPQIYALDHAATGTGQQQLN